MKNDKVHIGQNKIVKNQIKTGKVSFIGSLLSTDRTSIIRFTCLTKGAPMQEENFPAFILESMKILTNQMIFPKKVSVQSFSRKQ